MLNELKADFEAKLQQVVANWQGPSLQLIEAMRYVVLAPCKRLRPLLVYAAGNALSLSQDLLDPIALAVEFIHSYSLVHDDLPAMDDDPMRRGQPSCHVKFGEGVAVLAGDGLQGLGFETVLTSPLLQDRDKVTLALQLQHAVGYQGMIAGQALDIDALMQPALSETALATVHHHKTAALLQACITMPLCLCQGVDGITKKRLREVGAALGLAFQIQDDYLDRYGDALVLGRPAGSDLSTKRTTYADCYSRVQLAALIDGHYQQALQHCQALSATTLEDIIIVLQQRSNLG